MGGQQSRTRKLTIENEDPAKVIVLSEEVANRLKGSQAVRPIVDSEGYPARVPQPVFYEPSLTTLQLRQEKLDELRKNDLYWERRIENLQKNHAKIQEIMELEYKKAVDEVRGKRISDEFKLTTPPCIDNKTALLECYKKYPNEPMRCSKEVEEFTKCVDLKRAELMDKRS